MDTIFSYGQLSQEFYTNFADTLDDRLIFHQFIFSDPAIMNVIIPEYIMAQGEIESIEYYGDSKTYSMKYKKTRKKKDIPSVQKCVCSFRDAILIALTTYGYINSLVNATDTTNLSYLDSYGRYMDYVYNPDRLCSFFKVLELGNGVFQVQFT